MGLINYPPKKPEKKEASVDLSSVEAQKIEAWRFEYLTRAGYDAHAAGLLAPRWKGEETIDLHRAVGLLENGCDQETALQILL